MLRTMTKREQKSHDMPSTMDSQKPPGIFWDNYNTKSASQRSEAWEISTLNKRQNVRIFEITFSFNYLFFYHWFIDYRS